MCETIMVQHALRRASVQCESEFSSTHRDPTGQKLPYNKKSFSQDFLNQHGIEERNIVCCNALLDQFYPSLSEVRQKRRQLMKDFHHKYIYFFHTINTMSGQNYKSSPELNSPFRYLCQPFPELSLRLPHFLSTLSGLLNSIMIETMSSTSELHYHHGNRMTVLITMP